MPFCRSFNRSTAADQRIRTAHAMRDCDQAREQLLNSVAWLDEINSSVARSDTKQPPLAPHRQSTITVGRVNGHGFLDLDALRPLGPSDP